MNKIISLFIIVLITAFLAVGNYYIFKSFRAQKIILQDQKLTLSLKEVDSLLGFFPNFSSQAMPLDTYRAKYYLKENNMSKALSKVINARKVNPHTYISELTIGRVYYNIGVMDSAFKYAKKAFYGWPKHVEHFKFYNEVLAKKGDTLEILNIMNMFSGDKEYFQVANDYYNKAKLSYLITEFDNLTPVSEINIEGTWQRVYHFPQNKIVDSSRSYSFSKKTALVDNTYEFKYEVVRDSIYFKFLSSNKLINRVKVLYSKEYNTIIFKNVTLENGIQDQYFIKID